MSATLDNTVAARRPRLGFAGLGWIGRMRLQSVASSQLGEITAIADPDAQAVAQAAAIASGAELLSSFEKLIAVDLDGVVIASLSALHARQAMAALQTGKAVFCQKPLACTADDTRAIIQQANTADRLLATDFVYRFTAGMRAVRELITGGVLGEIYAAELCFHNSYGPDRPWYYNPALSGGGCVMDLGIHLADLALWALGFPRARSVSSRLFHHGKPFRSPDPQAVEDHAVADLDLEGDVLIHLACSWARPMSGDALIQAIFHGTRGAAEFHNVNGSFFDFRADYYHDRQRRQLCSPPDDWSGRALLQWVQQLAVSKRFSPAAEQIARVAEIIDAIYVCSDNPGIPRSLPICPIQTQ